MTYLHCAHVFKYCSNLVLYKTTGYSHSRSFCRSLVLLSYYDCDVVVERWSVVWLADRQRRWAGSSSQTWTWQSVELRRRDGSGLFTTATLIRLRFCGALLIGLTAVEFQKYFITQTTNRAPSGRQQSCGCERRRFFGVKPLSYFTACQVSTFSPLWVGSNLGAKCLCEIPFFRYLLFVISSFWPPRSLLTNYLLLRLVCFRLYFMICIFVSGVLCLVVDIASTSSVDCPQRLFFSRRVGRCPTPAQHCSSRSWTG